VNLVLGVRIAGGHAGWRAKLVLAGSFLALASPVVLCFAFVLEAPEVSPDRILTLLGVFAAALGVAAHVVSGAASR
jgi:hypothetical protein